MTMPPQPPPGPPGQNGPYGANGPYGPPPQQGPWGPQQGPWGGPPPMAPAPRKKRGALIAGIVAGSLAVLGVVGYGVAKLADASGVTKDFPAAEHKLTVPETLVDGKYKLVQDMSDTEGKKLTESDNANFRVSGAAVGQYVAVSAEGGTALVVSGGYGQSKFPDAERAAVLKGAADAPGAKTEVPAKDVTPAGSDVTIECAVLSSDTAEGRGVYPMCAWGDGNTVAAVGIIDTSAATAKPEDVDLAAAAKLTLQVRQEIRVPLN
ncbi:hypothetical protein ACFPM3_27275 [Streptomyces coeruleoprunus]|uniref:Uncharacterized protein n=1 Tax=Streptomyces coeruleoprunus TaxID=285563 RepID=A0ABV9XNA1_9ACTN